MSPRRTLAVLSALAVVVGPGCSGDDDDGGGSSAPATDGATIATDDESGATAPAVGGTEVDPASNDTPPTDPPETSGEPTTTLGTVPDTGVPGIDSSDLFCRSWSQFAGSFQALAVAAAFGADSVAATRLEVIASPALIAAVDGLDGELPAELESERSALVSDLAGPMVRRAERARGDLAAAGLSDAEIDELGRAWLTALAENGTDDPDLVVVVGGVDDVAVDAAVESFAGALPAINEDPSLITDARSPLTEQFLLENCPDQGTLGGNDVIDG